MAVFYVKPTMMESGAGELSDIMASLETIKEEINSVGGSLSFEMQAIARIKSNVKSLAERVGEEAVITGLLSSALIDTAAIYRNYEQIVLDNASGKVSGSDPVPQIATPSNVEDMSYQDMIDLLNVLSLSTTVGGMLSTVLEYVLDLAVGPGLVGDVVGLVTGVAADIMYALDHGSTQNALLADILVDFAFFGVGAAGSVIGGAVGTAVGGLAGTAVGGFVGGLVGNGVVLLMSVDFNGDAEGGVGKDALTDWIDNQLDKFVDDQVLDPFI